MVTESDAQVGWEGLHRRRSMRSGGRAVWAGLALTAAVLAPLGNRASAQDSSEGTTPHTRVVEAMVDGRLENASALLDSLLREDPTDLTAGYLAARVDEQRGRLRRTRCRYLELEAKARGTREAELAFLRRRQLERRSADAIFEGGELQPAETSSRGLLLLPLEDLSASQDHPYFGLAWMYLMQEALQGSGLCPVSVPAALLAVEQLSSGIGTRAPASLLGRPINTTGGLRARLAVLPGKDGAPLLADAEGEWDDPLRRALEGFQAEHELPVTGDADRTTLAEIERAMDLWLRRPPSLLAPALLPPVMREVGATMAARGTYRFEGTRIAVQLSLIDLAGRPLLAAPVTLNFETDETVREARRAAAAVAEGAGVRLADRDGTPRLSVETLEACTVLLLLQDRGLAALSIRDWNSLPDDASSWTVMRNARLWSDTSPGDSRRLEEQLVDDWSHQVRLDVSESFERFLHGLDSGQAWEAEAGPLDVVGSDGVIRIHGEAP